jgi:hypothetical protein
VIGLWIAVGVVTYLMIGGVVGRVHRLRSTRSCRYCKAGDICYIHVGGGPLFLTVFWGPLAIGLGPWWICCRIGDLVDRLISRDPAALIDREKP